MYVRLEIWIHYAAHDSSHDDDLMDRHVWALTCRLADAAVTPPGVHDISSECGDSAAHTTALIIQLLHKFRIKSQALKL